MEAVEFGKYLKELRKNKGLTQKQLAEKLGKAESTIRMWELGKNRLIPEILKQLAETLDIEYNELMKAAGYIEESPIDLEIIDNMIQVIQSKEAASVPEEAAVLKIKRLVLVTGDEYEQVELLKEVPMWFKENVTEDFIGVKSDTFKIFINSSMIVSVELEETKLQVISS